MGELNKEAYASGEVTSSSGMSNQLGSPSSEVLLTDTISEKKKKLKKFNFEDAKGLVTTINGKKLKLTGLTEKEKDEYLFGSAKLKNTLTKLEESLNKLDSLKNTQNS